MGSAAWAVLVSGLLGGALGVVGSIVVSRTQSRRGRQAEWFRRVQWGEQLTADHDEGRKAAGYRVLNHLARSPMADDDDRSLLLALVRDSSVDALTSNRRQDDHAEVGHGDD